MKTKYKTLVGVLGVMVVACVARVASAGSWGSFVSNGALGTCSTPTGVVGDNMDADLANYSLFMQHTSGHIDQIRGQATNPMGAIFCTSGFFGDGQSVPQTCADNVTQYRCQTNRVQ